MRGFSRSIPQASRQSTGPDHNQDESGSVLILALVFLVAVSLIVGGLLTLVGNSLNVTSSFANDRSVESAATSAVNLAIQNTRLTFTSQLLNASPPQACWYGAGGSAQQPQSFDNQQMDVWCSMVWQPFSADTRTITYSACPSTLTNTQCAAEPTLQAIISFDDYEPGLGVPTSSPVQCNLTGFCGQSQTQNSWLWNPTVPSVSSISPTTATINGTNASTGISQTVTITGSGFIQGASSVNFVQETGASGNPANTPSTANSPAGVIVTIPASQVTWGGCAGQSCTLSLTAPAVTSGTDYFVTVTTPGGTSPYLSPLGTLLDLQVTNQGNNTAPTVTGISGSDVTNGVPGGSVTGGGTIALTGSGFYNASNFAAQVWLWPQAGGSKVEATNVNVASGGSLTAVAPPVNAPGTYYVQVDTLGGTSTSTSYLFSYAVQVPIIISLSPSKGTTNAQVTVTGENFLSGSTVTLFQDSNGAQSGSGVNASASVTSQSALTFSVPSGMQAGNYFPVITLPSPYTSYASQPYNESSDIFTHS